MSLVKSLNYYKEKINRLEGYVAREGKEKKRLKRSVRDLDKQFENIVMATKIVQEVASETQKQLEFQLSSIVTSAIQAIFKKNYEFKIDFIQKRNKTEADIYLLDEKGNKFYPQHDNGGGVVDVVAFSLRLACWRINNPKTRSMMIFDEPLKFVSEEYKEAVSDFLKEISEKMNMQIIMITHEKAFVEKADNIIRIE